MALWARLGSRGRAEVEELIPRHQPRVRGLSCGGRTMFRSPAPESR
jgi:hypothetical protein